MAVHKYEINENEISKSQQKTNLSVEKSSIEKAKKPVQVHSKTGKIFTQMREEGKKEAEGLTPEEKQEIQKWVAYPPPLSPATNSFDGSHGYSGSFSYSETTLSIYRLFDNSTCINPLGPNV